MIRLTEIAGLLDQMARVHKEFLANLTPFAIESRYGDYRSKLSEIINKRTAGVYLKNTHEVYKWLRKKMLK